MTTIALLLLALQADTQAPTQATFTSTTVQPWDVVVDGQAMCATPCSGPLWPSQFVVLRTQERRPILVEVGPLPPGNVLVTGKPLQAGRYAGGIVATTLGGMALATGITLASVGLAKDRAGLTTAGLISGAAGLLAVPGGIYLMLSAVPSARIDQVAGARVGIAGTF